jgi:hypothetical protein
MLPLLIEYMHGTGDLLDLKKADYDEFLSGSGQFRGRRRGAKR